jgi:hypothetical protein
VRTGWGLVGSRMVEDGGGGLSGLFGRACFEGEFGELEARKGWNMDVEVVLCWV